MVIRFPQRGEKRRLMEMAQNNADTYLSEKLAADSAVFDLLERLKKKLHMTRLPDHIECFDNSNISGSSPVAGMVVFQKGKPAKSMYRHYNIKHVSGPDDYASMSEILRRRFKPNGGPVTYPDLLMLDGGKGQLNIALAVLNDLGLTEKLRVAAIAKKDESRGEDFDKIYLPHRSNPVIFRKDQDLLLFLQRIRDEAHRFAVSFHRKKRKKAFIKSVLDEIPGIGKMRKETLLKHFGSVKKIRAATLTEISELPGFDLKTAESVLNFLRTVND